MWAAATALSYFYMVSLEYAGWVVKFTDYKHFIMFIKKSGGIMWAAATALSFFCMVSLEYAGWVVNIVNILWCTF